MLGLHRAEGWGRSAGHPAAEPAAIVSASRPSYSAALADPPALADLRVAAYIDHGKRAKHGVVHWVVRHMHHGHRGVVEGVEPRRQALIRVGVLVVTAK
jgi:hypothetical protein